jgi:hypothetical protein
VSVSLNINYNAKKIRVVFDRRTEKTRLSCELTDKKFGVRRKNMNLRPKLILALAAGLLAAICIAVAQQAADDLPTAFETNIEPINFFGNEPEPTFEEKTGILGVDPSTWKIVGLDPEGIGINAPLPRLGRHLVAMQMLAPEAYGQLFPPTAEQLANLEESFFELLQPEAYAAQVNAQKTPDQLKQEAEERAILLDQFSHPSLVPQGPPPEAFPEPLGMPTYDSSPTPDGAEAIP